MSNLTQIKRLMFTGGEPTLIPEVKKIISQLIDEKLDHLSVLIITNASFTDNFWYTLPDKLTNLHWTASIDAVGPAAEIIRNGTKWATVEKNLHWLAKNASSLNVNTVISKLNIFQLKPLLKLVRTLQINSIAPAGKHGSNGLRHQFHVDLRSVNWPNEQQQLLIKYLNEILEMDLDDEQRSTVQGLLTATEQQKFKQTEWDQSRRFNRLLDQIRNENSGLLETPAEITATF
jgi:sulfatase maturation enzyme AslB (radical SAM superfamily)